MKNPKARRIARVLTAREKDRLSRNRRRIAHELPELLAGDQMRKEAREEPTLSGELRRAIHASPMSLADIAAHAAITPMVLDEFLTGERTLRSDVLDRLTSSLKLELSARE